MDRPPVGEQEIQSRKCEFDQKDDRIFRLLHQGGNNNKYNVSLEFPTHDFPECKRLAAEKGHSREQASGMCFTVVGWMRLLVEDDWLLF